MADRIWIDAVSEQPIAAVRLRAALADIPNVFRDALDKVWAFLRQRDGLRTDGHNVFVYDKNDDVNDDDKITIEFGVQVTRVFTGEGDVICSATPGGRAAMTVHVGPYHRLGRAHAAVQQWCVTNGHELAGIDWEVYGDWNDDQTKLETRVCYLLR